MLVHHGINSNVGPVVVGRVKRHDIRDDGVHATILLDKAHALFSGLMKRARRGLLGLSSGTMAHLVQTKSDGQITRWPWIELSLTPTPSNPDARLYAVKAADAFAHLSAVGLPYAAIKSLLGPSLDQAELEVIALDELALARQHLAGAEAHAVLADSERLIRHLDAVLR